MTSPSALTKTPLKPADLYYEDFHVGRVFQSPGCTVTESAIIDFATLYDPQPFHMDVEAAGQNPLFQGLTASGWHSLALTFRLFQKTGALLAANTAGRSLEKIRWRLPVRPGDTLYVTVTVKEAWPSQSKPDRGLVRMDYATHNQRGETVLSFSCVHILLKRHPDKPFVKNGKE